MTGVEHIAKERSRQFVEKGRTSEHDDKHTKGELADAAACYALTPRQRDQVEIDFWPWGPNRWKPSPRKRIRELEKAGALIAAEIDRLNRIEIRKVTP